MSKRVFALFLCLMMCLSLLPASAFATDETTYYNVRFYNFEEMVSEVPGGVQADDLIPEEYIPGKDILTGGTCFHGWKDRDTEQPFDPVKDKVTKDLKLKADWGEHVADTTKGVVAEGDQADCTTDGWTTYPCLYCGASVRLQDITAKGHDIQRVPAVDPTCTEEGHDSYFQCANCKTLYSDAEGTEVITAESKTRPKSEHDWQPVDAVPESCGEDGTEAYKVCKHCGVKDPENAPITVKATGNHTWKNVAEERYLKEKASCAAPAEYYKSCEVCGLRSDTEFFSSGEPNDHHHFVDNVCTECDAKQASVRLVFNEGGTATLNGQPAESDKEVVVEPGEVSIGFEAGERAYLSAITVGGTGRDSLEVPFKVTVSEGEPCTVVTATFIRCPDDAEAVARPSSTGISEEALAAIDARQEMLAKAAQVEKNQVYTSVRKFTPFWNDDEHFPVTNDEVTKLGGVLIRMPYPEEIAPAERDQFEYSICHFNGVGLESLDAIANEDNVSAIAGSFSDFALFAVPVVSKTTDPSASASAPLVVSKTTPAPPKLGVAPIIDDGSTQTGAIMGVDASMEYMRKGSSEGYKPVAGTMLDDLAAGTYYVRYKETTTTNASDYTVAVIEEYYTVKAKLLYGKGSYEITSDHEVFDDELNTYLVKKGGSITFRFYPANHYWLYVININDVYVGQKNVKTTFTLENIRQKSTVSYGFSDSSSSPKTGDSSDVFKWGVTEVVCLVGMTWITWYLFRKKEDW